VDFFDIGSLNLYAKFYEIIQIFWKMRKNGCRWFSENVVWETCSLIFKKKVEKVIFFRLPHKHACVREKASCKSGCDVWKRKEEFAQKCTCLKERRRISYLQSVVAGVRKCLRARVRVARMKESDKIFCDPVQFSLLFLFFFVYM
jgi:hypothetical protein